MNLEHFNKAFLPKDLILKLYKDLSSLEVDKKLALVNQHAERVKEDFDREVYEILLNKELGLCYWEARQYSSAVVHFEQVLQRLSPHVHPATYFLVIGTLIRCHTQLKEYQKGLFWSEKALNTIDIAESSFVKLSILADYADLLTQAQLYFDEKFNPIITGIIDDLGFPEKLMDPIETILRMKQLNRKWNRELSDIHLSENRNDSSRIKAFEAFRQQCPIGWYRNYVEEIIETSKNQH